MASPQQPTPVILPAQEQPQTYDEIVLSLTCAPCGGANIRPSGLLPSGTINIGDAIADITSHLTSFANGYSIILTILQMIGCIIEVICAISNPFAVIPAVIRLFTECIPAFILIFPIFIVPCIILCFIKIVIAIVSYILESVIPVILDIIENIQNLTEAFAQANPDAQTAIAFKISGLIQELRSILGILAVLGAIFDMIKALIRVGSGIPCGSGPGGACIACGDEFCPSLIQSGSISGTDGVMTVFFGADGFSFTLRFTSPSRADDFRTIRDFFPVGLDYASITEEEIPYIITVEGNSFAITSVDAAGGANLLNISTERLDDGYLSSTVKGDPTDIILSDPYIRFGTDTPTFSASMVGGSIPRYIDILETRDGASTNSGTWEIVEFYDEYNVRIEHDGTPATWLGSNSALDQDGHLLWRLVPTPPTAGSGQTFTVDINHEELYRHGVIGVGCHPAIKAARDSAVNRFPDLGENQVGSLESIGLGDFPDLDALIADLNNRVAALGPPNTDSILDNYQEIGEAAAALDLETPLNAFVGELTDYARGLCPIVVDVEQTTLTADPNLQTVGDEVIITLTPNNRAGTPLAFDLPPGVLDVEINASAGSLTTPVELLDEYGASTGSFQSILTSDDEATILITASVCGKDIADFNGAELVQRSVQVRFIPPDSKRSRAEGEVSTEPLGVGQQ